MVRNFAPNLVRSKPNQVKSFTLSFRFKCSKVQLPGSTVVLTCDVDGNPFPDITWYHEDKKVSTSPNLTLRVDQANAGRYYCKAHVTGFQDIGAEAAIYLKG